MDASGLRLAFAAATVWLFASAVLSLMPKVTAGAGTGPSTVTEVLRGMADGAVAAVTLPGDQPHARGRDRCRGRW